MALSDIGKGFGSSILKGGSDAIKGLVGELMHSSGGGISYDTPQPTFQLPAPTDQTQQNVPGRADPFETQDPQIKEPDQEKAQTPDQLRLRRENIVEDLEKFHNSVVKYVTAIEKNANANWQYTKSVLKQQQTTYARLDKKQSKLETEFREIDSKLLRLDRAFKDFLAKQDKSKNLLAKDDDDKKLQQPERGPRGLPGPPGPPGPSPTLGNILRQGNIAFQLYQMLREAQQDPGSIINRHDGTPLHPDEGFWQNMWRNMKPEFKGQEELKKLLPEQQKGGGGKPLGALTPGLSLLEKFNPASKGNIQTSPSVGGSTFDERFGKLPPSLDLSGGQQSAPPSVDPMRLPNYGPPVTDKNTVISPTDEIQAMAAITGGRGTGDTSGGTPGMGRGEGSVAPPGSNYGQVARGREQGGMPNYDRGPQTASLDPSSGVPPTTGDSEPSTHAPHPQLGGPHFGRRQDSARIPSTRDPRGQGAVRVPSGDYDPEELKRLNVNRPYHDVGLLTFEGQQFHYGTGGSKRGSAPYGDTEFHLGAMGGIGRRIGALGTFSDVGKGADAGITDPKYPNDPRRGIELHPSSGLITEGCIGVAGREWPQLKARVLQWYRDHPGQTLILHRTPQGASLSAKGAPDQQDHVKLESSESERKRYAENNQGKDAVRSSSGGQEATQISTKNNWQSGRGNELGQIGSRSNSIIPYHGGKRYEIGSDATQDAIGRASQKYGIDPNYMRSVGSIESSMNPSSNMNKRTQYKGLFQIGHEEWSKYGHGRNIYDPYANADAAGQMWSDQRKDFQKKFGRAPTDEELYMIHQQGMGFFTKGKMTNIMGNKYPGMQGYPSHDQFMHGWGQTIAQRKGFYVAQFGEGGTQYAQNQQKGGFLHPMVGEDVTSPFVRLTKDEQNVRRTTPDVLAPEQYRREGTPDILGSPEDRAARNWEMLNRKLTETPDAKMQAWLHSYGEGDDMSSANPQGNWGGVRGIPKASVLKGQEMQMEQDNRPDMKVEPSAKRISDTRPEESKSAPEQHELPRMFESYMLPGSPEEKQGKVSAQQGGYAHAPSQDTSKYPATPPPTQGMTTHKKTTDPVPHTQTKEYFGKDPRSQNFEQSKLQSPNMPSWTQPFHNPVQGLSGAGNNGYGNQRNPDNVGLCSID